MYSFFLNILSNTVYKCKFSAREYWVTAQHFLKLSRKVGLEVTLIQLPISGKVSRVPRRHHL